MSERAIRHLPRDRSPCARGAALAAALVLAAPLPGARAQDEAKGGDLAATAQNPIASSVRVPLESSFLFNSGPDGATGYVGNLQPVLPASISENWNLISRPILPIMFTPGAVAGLGSNPGTPIGFEDTFGIGDLNYTAFFSPKNSKGITWGVGPSITAPIASDDVLGSGKWSAGPSFVALEIAQPFVGGALLRQLWSFAGDEDRENVSQTLIQPFLNYNLASHKGTYLMTAPVVTANWSADSSERWTVPIGGGIGKVFKIGTQAASTHIAAYYNVERPTDAPEWVLQFNFALMFPK